MTICVEFVTWLLKNKPEELIKIAELSVIDKSKIEDLYVEFINERDAEG
jgi:hypothetical protein